MATDPKRALLDAANSNGLGTEGVKPWRIVTSYEEVDTNGSVTNRGTFEELWVGPDKFKRSFIGDAFTIVEYGTAKGIVRIGGADRNDWELTALHQALADPLPKSSELDGMDFEVHAMKSGDLQLDCIALKKKPTAFVAPLLASASYCFDRKDSFLRSRFLMDQGVLIVCENPNSFRNRIIPGDIALFLSGKLALKVRVETYQEITDANDVLFTPPRNATSQEKANELALLSAEEATKNLLKQVPPQYPPIARAARIQGTVVLQALIDKHGNVTEVGVVSGHPILQQAAIDAVRQWIFKPYKVNGKAIPIYSTLKVVFVLGQ